MHLSLSVEKKKKKIEKKNRKKKKKQENYQNISDKFLSML